MEVLPFDRAAVLERAGQPRLQGRAQRRGALQSRPTGRGVHRRPPRPLPEPAETVSPRGGHLLRRRAPRHRLRLRSPDGPRPQRIPDPRRRAARDNTHERELFAERVNARIQTIYTLLPILGVLSMTAILRLLYARTIPWLRSHIVLSLYNVAFRDF